MNKNLCLFYEKQCTRALLFCLILAAIFSALTAVARVSTPSADSSDAALTAVVKVSTPSADSSNAALTAVARANATSADNSVTALTAVVRASTPLVDSSDVALTAVVRTNATSAEADTDSAIGAAENALNDAWERFLELLPGEIRDTVGEGSLPSLGGIAELPAALLSLLDGLAKETAALAALLLFAAVAFAIAELFAPEAISETVNGTLSVIMSMPVLRALADAVSGAIHGLGAACEFFGSLIPLITTVATVGIGNETAAAYAAVMSITLGGCEWLLLDKLYLLFALIFALGVLGCIDTGGGIAKIAMGVRSLFGLLFGIVPTVLLGTLSLCTFITASRDTLLLRGFKYAISGTPVVGGIVSASLGSLIGAAKLVSGAIGPLAVAAMLYYLLRPLLGLLLLRLLLSLAATVARVLGTGAGESFFASHVRSVDCLLAPLAAGAISAILQIAALVAACSGVNV